MPEWFGIGFTKRDVVRSVWAFLAAFAVTMAGYGGDVSKSAVWAAVAAGLVAVKNLFLADGSLVKG
jgi:hypothetical protein